MGYVLNFSEKPTFTQKGLKGYQYPLSNQAMEIYYVDVQQGHDTFIVSKKITHIYFILEGSGFFTIERRKYAVSSGTLIEVPPNVEYTYSGSMKLLLIMQPPWFDGNEEITRNNPDVKG